MVAIGVNDDGCREGRRRRRGLHRVLGVLAGAPLVAEVARAARRPHARRRQGRRDGRLDRRGVPGVRRTRGAPPASTATCWPGCPSPGAPRSPRCRGPSMRWSRARRPRPRRSKVASEPEASRPREAAEVVREGFAETLTCTRFPREHWRRMRRQRRHRAPQPGDPTQDEGGGDVPRRELRPHARDREGSSTSPRASGAPARYPDVTLLEEAHREAGI